MFFLVFLVEYESVIGVVIDVLFLLIEGGVILDLGGEIVLFKI